MNKILSLSLLTFLLSATVSYSQTDSEWTLVTEHTAFSPRDCGGTYNKAVVFDGKIWISGGYNWEYLDIVPDQWCSSDGSHWVQVKSTSDRYNLSLVYNNKLWQTNHYILSSDDGIKWSNSADSPEDGYTVSFKNKIWLIGTTGIYSSEDLKTWTHEKDSLPWPKRSFFGLTVFNDRLWVIGGVNYPDLTETYNDVWSSADGINWVQVTANADWSRRRFFTPIVYKGKLWVIAGQDMSYPYGINSGNSNEVWYSSDGAKWYKYYREKTFLPRHAPFTVVFNDNIYVFGGYANNDNFYNDVWKLNINKLTITSEPIKTIDINSHYTYSVHADFSANNDTIRYRIRNAPLWMSIDSASGLISGVPTSCSISDSTVAVEAYTANGENALQTFNIKVLNPAINAKISSSGPTSFCKGSGTYLFPDSNYLEYNWNTGDTSREIEVHNTGDYYVVVKDEIGCTDSSNVVTITTLPDIKIAANSYNYICEGDSLQLYATAVFSDYLWSTGQTTPLIYVKNSEEYFVIAKDMNGCSDTSNKITVNVKPLPAPEIITSDTLCAGKANFLSTGQYHDYLWTDGEETRVASVDQPGSYSVWVTDYHGCRNQSKSKYVYPQPEAEIIADPSFTFNFGDSIKLFSSLSYPFIHWNTGENTPGITVKSSGDYFLTVMDYMGCKATSDTVHAKMNLDVALFEESRVYPNPTSGNLTIRMNDLKYINLDLYVIDIKGSIVIHSTVYNEENQIKLDLSALNSGSYILLFKYHGRTILSKKLIKTNTLRN